MMMLVLFGYALTLDVDNVPMVVWDQSYTARQPRSGQPFLRLAVLLARAATCDNYREVQGAIDCRPRPWWPWWFPAISPPASRDRAAASPCN